MIAGPSLIILGLAMLILSLILCHLSRQETLLTSNF
jgi:hypothetical protein